MNEHNDYDDLAEEIRKAKEEKDQALARQAQIEEREKQNQQMQEFFDSHKPGDLQYRDEYVRKLVDEIRVNPASLTVKFKSGTEVEIPV